MSDEVAVEQVSQDPEAVLSLVRAGRQVTVVGSHGKTLLTVSARNGSLFEQDEEPDYDDELVAADAGDTASEQEAVSYWLR